MKSACLMILFCLLSGILTTGSPFAFSPDVPGGVTGDWLVDRIQAPAGTSLNAEGQLVFSNGLISRTFSLKPNCATVALDLFATHESFVRSIRPEATISLNGVEIPVGGLTGQPIHNYLLPAWISAMKPDPASFRMTKYHLEEIRERFPWKKRDQWISGNVQWPSPGKELVFEYRLDSEAARLIAAKFTTPQNRPDVGSLQAITVAIHYELYDNMPLLCKWLSVRNDSGFDFSITGFKSEILAATEAESESDDKKVWLHPNITVISDYSFGGISDEQVFETSAAWNLDPLYKTQVNYERTMPCLLEVSPKIGPSVVLKKGDNFSTYRVWELIHDSRDRERKGLAERRVMRALAPWVTENPILMHVRKADDAAVKKAIDQCADVGFEMVIMTFGSGFNLEDESPENIARMKRLADYAHSRGIALGGYSLLASRTVSKDDDVLMPEGKKPRFGHSPCLDSQWGINYFRKLYRFYEETGLDILEHDGSYPGDVCLSANHPGHKGLEDSQWSQYNRIQDFYRWCRGKGIYLNVPDNFYLNGSSKCGMGYRETNWSLPREQQEIIERQNIYDGTWRKTPSMGWMFVPLVEYQGGGDAATIEPLKEHLPHYGQRLANLFGAGVQACYRGPQLYDAPETRELVKHWVDFYRLHRRVLNGDIIHVRRADGRDYDAILHVEPSGQEKGLLMVYNPLEEKIHRTIKLNVWYTGLKKRSKITFSDGRNGWADIGPDGECEVVVDIPAKSQEWLVFR